MPHLGQGHEDMSQPLILNCKFSWTIGCIFVCFFLTIVLFTRLIQSWLELPAIVTLT